MNITFSKVKEYLLYLFIFLIPLTHKEAFSFLDPDLVWSKYVMMICAGFGAYILIKNFKEYKKDVFFLLLFIFDLFQILSLLQSRDINNSLKYIGFQTGILFLYVFVNDYMKRQAGKIDNIVRVYVMAFAFVTGFLIRQVYLQSMFGIATGGVWPIPGYPTRYGSTFWDVNHFGAYIASLFFLFSGYYLSKHRNGLFRKPLDYLYLLFPVFMLVILYLTESRSALIGFIVGILVFLTVYLSKERKLRYFVTNAKLLLGSGLFLTGSVFVFMRVFDKILRASFLYRAVSFYAHLFLLKVGIQLGIQNFLFGIGVNAFSSYFKTSHWADSYYYIDRAALNLKLPLHNLWLEILVETGLVSFLFFAALWVILLYLLYRIYKAKKDFVALGLIAGTVSYLVGGFFYSYKAEFFWFYVILACSYVTYHYGNFDIKTVFKNKVSLLKISAISISLAGLLVPLILITSPLNVREIGYFYDMNPMFNNYKYLLDLFRYIIGNYSFTGRFVSLIVYVGSIFTLMGFMRRIKVSIASSFLMTAIVFSFIGMFTYVLSVSFYNFGILCIILAASTIGFSVLKNVKLRMPDYKYLLIVLAVLTGLNVFTYIRTYQNSYDSDLSLLVELASNRGKTNNAKVYIQDESWRPLIKYFSDHLDIPNDGFTDIKSEDVRSLSDFGGLSNKDIFIVDESYVSPMIDLNSLDVEVVHQGKYKLIMNEVKASHHPVTVPESEQNVDY